MTYRQLKDISKLTVESSLNMATHVDPQPLWHSGVFHACITNRNELWHSFYTSAGPRTVLEIVTVQPFPHLYFNPLILLTTDCSSLGYQELNMIGALGS